MAAASINVQKYLTAPAKLPDHLIWFKWEAYLTWVTGFLLLIVLYYLNASTYLIDPGDRAAAHAMAGDRHLGWQALLRAGSSMTGCAGRRLGEKTGLARRCASSRSFSSPPMASPMCFRGAAR